MAKQENPGYSSWHPAAIAAIALIPGGNTALCLGINFLNKSSNYNRYLKNNDVFQKSDLLVNAFFDGVRLIAVVAMAFANYINPSETALVFQAIVLSGASIMQTVNVLNQFDEYLKSRV